MDADIASFVNEGLGHSSYLVDLGDGTALVIDPARIPTAQLAHAAERGLASRTRPTPTPTPTTSRAAPTSRRGARRSWRPAAAGLDRDHRGLADGDIVEVGRYRLEAIATPGHTPDHLAYLLSDDAGSGGAVQRRVADGRHRRPHRPAG